MPGKILSAVIQLLKRYGHTNWTLMDQTMVSAVNFFTGILLARYLGITDFGVFSLLWMVVLFVNSLQNALIISPMMSIAPKQSAGEAPVYFGALSVQQIVVALLSFISIFAGVEAFGMFFPQWGIGHMGISLAAATAALQSQDFIRRYLFTKSRPVAAFLNDLLSYGGQITILFWLFISGSATIANVLWVIAGTSTLAIMLGIKQMERLQCPTTDYFISTCQRHWDFSKWLTASALMEWTSSKLFTIAAAAYLGAEAAGAMQACQNILGALHVLFFGLGNIVPVRASLLLHRDGAMPMLAYLRKVALFGGAATAFFAILVAIAPEFWLQLVYGEEYISYGYVLQWFSVIYLLIFFTIPLRAGLASLEYNKPVFVSRVLTTIFTLIGVAPLISHFEMVGALGGILAVKIIQYGITLTAFRKKIKKLA